MVPIASGNVEPKSEPGTTFRQEDSVKFESTPSDEPQTDIYPSRSSIVGRVRKMNWEHPRLKNALSQQYYAGPPNSKKRLVANGMALVLLRLFMKSKLGS